MMSQPALAPEAPAAPPSNSPANAPKNDGGQNAAPAWLGEVTQPENQSWIQQKGWQKLDDVIDSQRGLEKLKGAPANELLRLKPGWEADPEASAQVYARVGRPEKAEDYEIPAFPVGEGDQDLAPEFKKWAHEAGLSKSQAAKLATQYQGASKAAMEAREAAIAERNEREDRELRAEWGGAYGENETAAKAAVAAIASAVGLTGEDLDAISSSKIGYAKTMKMFALLGRSLGEHKAVTGSDSPGGRFGMTPEAARAKAREIHAQLQTMENTDPRYRDLLNQATQLYHSATGEDVPEVLRRR
jgi:hypothetical protein